VNGARRLRDARPLAARPFDPGSTKQLATLGEQECVQFGMLSLPQPRLNLESAQLGQPNEKHIVRTGQEHVKIWPKKGLNLDICRKIS